MSVPLQFVDRSASELALLYNYAFGLVPAGDMNLNLGWKPPVRCFLIAMPNEIFHLICQEVVGDGKDKLSLAKLAQTCKILSRVAIPVLYKNIKDGPSNREHGRAKMPLGCLQALLLAFSLHSNPDLGTLVRSIDFHGGDDYASPGISDGSGTSLQRFSSMKHQLFGAYQGHEPTTEMAFLCLTPNLATFKFTASRYTGDTDFLLNKTNRRVTGPRFTFRRLTSLTVYYTNDGNIYYANLPIAHGINLRKLYGLFYTVPNLQSLTIDRPRGGTTLTGRLPHLTSLTLTSSYLTFCNMQKLLRSCNNLVHFHYTPDKHGTLTRYLPTSPAQVLEALKPAAGTLQRLHLAPSIPAAGDPRTAKYELLETLAGFPGLKQVAVDYRAVVKRDGEWDGLVKLLEGCGALKGVFLFGVVDMNARELECLAKRVVGVEWPRLRRVKLQSWRALNEVEELFGMDLASIVESVDMDVRDMKAVGVEVEALEWDVKTGAFAED